MFGNYTISDSCDNHNHVCEVDYNLDPADNFLEDERSYARNSFLYAISCMALICFAGTLFHFTNKTIVFYKDLSIISIIFLTLIFAFDVYTMGKETCLFAKWCHEGIDDQIIPGFYFYQMNECPRSNSWLTDDYFEFDVQKNDSCETAKYGCCEVRSIDCDAAYDDDYGTYSFYQMILNDYRGSWSISINKQDKEGTNCPTVEDVIYRASTNDKNDYLVLYLSYTITTMIFMCIRMICRMCTKKDDYEKTDSDDVEKAKFVVKESV
jgi:hypothetical protein